MEDPPLEKSVHPLNKNIKLRRAVREAPKLMTLLDCFRRNLNLELKFKFSKAFLFPGLVEMIWTLDE